MDKKVKKSFAISNWAIDNKMTVFVIMFLITFAGIFSYNSMPREAFPEIVIPEIFVSTIYPGNSAMDMEKLITKPLEKEIKGISGVNKVTSTSLQGFSSIDIEFDFSVTPEEALRKVKDKVDAAMADKDFPKDLPADPNVKELNMAEFMPIMNINLSGNYALDKLQEYGEYLEDKIEALPEINAVDIRGIQDKEIAVAIDMYKMESSQISFRDINDAINYENMTISGGDILSNGARVNVRVIGEFKSPKELEEVIVKREKGNIVYLRDIATVRFQDQEKTSYAREFLNPVVMLDVKKRGGENLIAASEKINKIIDEAKAKVFPKKLNISITNDASDDTKKQVDSLANNIISGVILVVLVLLFFLGLRNALFVGIAIPLSMLMSFLILSAMGVTLNMMVLFGLILALGMLVDNGIVVVENIYRYLDEGDSLIKAAKNGVGEVAVPIIASTATTLAAFLPLAFWDGIMGEFMKYLPITLIIVLGSSLFVALIINPMLTSIYMKLEEKETKTKTILIRAFILLIFGGIIAFLNYKSWTNVVGLMAVTVGALMLINKFIFAPGTRWFQNKLLPYLEEKYKGFLQFALRGYNATFFLIGTFVLLFLSLALFGVFTPKVSFFPDTPPKQAYIYMEYPIGTDIEKTNQLSLALEEKIINHFKKYEKNGENQLVTSIIGQVGEGTSDPKQKGGGGNTPNKARITINFETFENRINPKTGEHIDTHDILKDIRKLVKGYAGATIVVDKPQEGPPVGAPITIEISGEDYEELLATSEGIKHFINEQNILGIEELKLDVEQGKQEMPIIVDRQKARRLGISTGQIGDALRTSLYGKEVSTYKDGDDDYPINIRLQDKYRYDKDILMNKKITFRDMATGRIVQVPIATVATAKKATTFSAIKRKDLKRVITITSNVLGDYNATEVNDNIKKALDNYKLPKDTFIKFGGEQEEQAKQMAFLLKALLIAVAMIFLIIVAQFNSTSVPVIISSSVLLSLIGVFLGLIISGDDFIILMTMIGIISLAGIVVNNAIVLLDYTLLIMKNKRKEHNIPADESLSKELIYESIVEGGKTRLRPVLLTAITTILGLFPLAYGINIDFFGFYTEFDANFFIGGENVAFWGPMSWTIIYGLTFATFLTLVIVPVMFYLLSNFKKRMGRIV
jgi:multidrug efflux pump subunit AcrB